MLTQQSLTRRQLATILNFKNDNSIRDLERKNFITPQIKPSKYTFNQILFMMICKEITDFTDLNWKYLIDVNLNCVLEKNLIDYDILFLWYFKNTKKLYVKVMTDDDNIVPGLSYQIDSGLSLITKLKGNEDDTKDDTNDDTKNFCTYDDKNCIYLLFPIDRMYQKLQRKCIELKIDLKEKIRA